MAMAAKGVAPGATQFEAPDMSSIETFLIAAETGSMAKTAAHLNISVSTAGRRIERMETSLGGLLFDRLYSGLQITALGLRTLPHAQRVQKSLKNLVAATSTQNSFQIKPKRAITIGGPEGLSAFWIARYVPAFLDQFPEVILNFETRSVLGAERKAPPDVIISVGPPLNGEIIRIACGGMHFVAYDARDPMCDAVSYDRRLAEHVDYIGTSQWINPSEEVFGQRRDFRLRTDSTSFLTTALRHGAGRALLPNFWHLLVDGLKPVNGSPSGYLPMYVSFQKGFADQPEGRAIVEWLKRVLKTAPWFGKTYVAPEDLNTDNLAAVDARILTAIAELSTTAVAAQSEQLSQSQNTQE